MVPRMMARKVPSSMTPLPQESRRSGSRVSSCFRRIEAILPPVFPHQDQPLVQSFLSVPLLRLETGIAPLGLFLLVQDAHLPRDFLANAEWFAEEYPSGLRQFRHSERRWYCVARSPLLQPSLLLPPPLGVWPLSAPFTSAIHVSRQLKHINTPIARGLRHKYDAIRGIWRDPL